MKRLRLWLEQEDMEEILAEMKRGGNLKTINVFYYIFFRMVYMHEETGKSRMVDIC